MAIAIPAVLQFPLRIANNLQQGPRSSFTLHFEAHVSIVAMEGIKSGSRSRCSRIVRFRETRARLAGACNGMKDKQLTTSR